MIILSLADDEAEIKNVVYETKIVSEQLTTH